MVWGPSLTEENKDDLERTQRSFAKLIMKNKYNDYEEALTQLNLDSLEERRQILISRFANNCIKNNKFKDLFEENTMDKMTTRNQEKFKVPFSNTNRMQSSSIIHMIKQLNKEHRNKETTHI